MNKTLLVAFCILLGVSALVIGCSSDETTSASSSSSTLTLKGSTSSS